MKTTDLVDALVADGGTPPVSLGAGFVLAVLIGTAVSGLVFFSALGVRPDFTRAAETPRFLLKFVECGAFAIAALVLARRQARPAADPRLGVALLVVAFALLVGAVTFELAVVPPPLWSTRLVGVDAVHCLTLVPAFAVPPFVALMWAARRGAPTRPHLAGAVVGLASAGIGAAFYAANCADDSPLFVATWYTLATLIVAGFGAVIGGRLLRW